MVNNITEIVWDIIIDNDELLSELTRIMCQEYKQFLSKDMATTVNTYQLEHYLWEELTTWYEWLPNTPISQIGGELAMEAFATVNFRHIGSLVLSRLQLAG